MKSGPNVELEVGTGWLHGTAFHPSLLAHILLQSPVALDLPVPPAVPQGRQDCRRSCALDFHSMAHVS